MGLHTITPNLACRDAARAIDFYKRAFGAEERGRMLSPDGRRVVHAELRIGSSTFHLADESGAPDGSPRPPRVLGGVSVTLQIYAANVDELWQRTLDADAKVVVPLQDMFWGDRYGVIEDPEGYRWALAEHQFDLTPEEISAAQAEWAARAAVLQARK